MCYGKSKIQILQSRTNKAVPFQFGRENTTRFSRSINHQIVDTLEIRDVIDTYKGGGTSAYRPQVMLKVV